jgi:hypothetical protein
MEDGNRRPAFSGCRQVWLHFLYEPVHRYAKRCRVAADGFCVGEGPGDKAITAVSSRKLRAGAAGNSHAGSACWEWKVFGLNLQGE